jgi:aminomethyltransferase
MVEFAGHELPVQYTGVIAESRAVREAVGMFDVSHMGRLRVAGPHALAFLEWTTSNDVAKLAPGSGHYSLLPNAQGGTVDDIVLYRTGPEEYRMVVNAANRRKDLEHLRSHVREGVQIEDYTVSTAMIAVQGPASAPLVAKLSDRAGAVSSAPNFAAFEAVVAGVPCLLARSGYTGEDGFEIQCPASEAWRIWSRLAEEGALPCGLGARDTLRLEAGLPLYGHELADDLSPIAAGLGWVVSKSKEFLGSAPINAAREAGTRTKLFGVRLESRRVAQPGAKVSVGESEAGRVSSGAFSPWLGCGVALAFLDSRIGIESPCTVDFRGKPEPGLVVGKRFYKRR